MRAGRIQLELSAGHLAPEDVAVTRVEGREGLSEPYAFAVDFVVRSGEEVVLEELIGREGELTLRRNTGEERVVHGECHRVEQTGVAAGVATYRVTLRPRLSRLALSTQSRIYQGKSVPQIVAAVLDRHGVAHRSALSGSYGAREYVAQYRETDLAFVSRLLEEEGIWYRFEHGPGSHELVLGDAPSGYAEAEREVPFHHAQEQAEEEHVHRLVREWRDEPGEVELREYDFERPGLEVTSKAGERKGPQVYEPENGKHEGTEGRERAKRRLEGLRYGTATFSGRGNALSFVPGATVQVEGVQAAKVLAVRVTHVAEQELSVGAAGERRATYRNGFEGIEAGRAYRPKRGTPAPRIRGIQTARVVGPPGEEVHVDRWGRVKVQFHWDREGKKDDKAGCWVRTGQAWAGPGMGRHFVPRVGQEVVVRFLEGNPDRPLVMGAIFNGEQVPAVALPQDKTRSALRTQSSPGGEGYNELTFEDQAGQEEVWVHAQKDETVEVRDGQTSTVRANERERVAKDRSTRVLGSQALEVKREDAAGVGGNAVLTVAGSRETQVAGSQAEQVGLAQTVTVGGAQDVSVAKAAVVSVGAAAALNVGGGYAINVGGAINELVGGAKSSQVGGEALVVTGARSEERVAKERDSTTKGDAGFNVEGAVRTVVDGNVTDTVDGKVTISAADLFGANVGKGQLKADKISVVVGGKLVLSLEKNGTLKLHGKTLTVDGQTIKLRGGKVKKEGAGGAGEGKADAVTLDPRATAFVLVEDADGAPLRGVRYRAKLADGSVLDGTTDADGFARIPAGSAKGVKIELRDRDGAAWGD